MVEGPLAAPTARQPLSRLVAAALAAVALIAPRAAVAGPLDDQPPVATITTAAGPGAPVHVRFDEAVGPIDTSNVILEHQDGSAIAANRRCRDASELVVSCAGTTTRSVRLDAVDPFPLGDHLTVVVNPAGVASPVADAAGNPVATTTAAQAVVADQPESGSGVTHVWPLVSAAGASAGSFRTASSAGMRASFIFVGDRVTWLTRTGPRDGLAELFVDGDLVRRFDLSATQTTLKVRKTFRGFGAGPHVAKIVCLARSGARGDGTAVTIDGFADDFAWYSQDRALYAWGSGGWPGARGSVTRSSTSEASLRIAFWGGGVDLRMPVGPAMGIADVAVDGARRRSIDLYRGSAGVDRFTVSGLSAGLHEIVITVSGRRDARSTGRAIGLDHVDTAAPVGMFRGLGTWVDLFDYGPSTSLAETRAMLETMRAHGVRTVYLETARYNSSRAFDYPSQIRTWLREAHARDMLVVGWYFPAYSEFLDTDVERTIAVATYRSDDGERFDAVGVDIEYRGKTSGPPEFNAGIVEQLERVRARLGVTYPISAIAPPPNQMELAPSTWAGFPWEAIGRLADVIQPMAYSSYRKGSQCPDQPRYCTRLYTRNAITSIRTETGDAQIPIHVIGGIADRLTRAEIADFVDGAEAADAYGASMYDHVTLMKDEAKYERLEAFTASG